MATALDPQYPFTAFNFSVEITPTGASAPLVSGAFAECDGLEVSMEAKTIREGGNNARQVRFAGPLTYGQLTLKRGMTRDFALWRWVTDSQQNTALRAETVVVVYGSEQSPSGGGGGQRTVRARFVLSRCLPLKIKAPSLNAKDGLVAIEELQLAYEQLELREGG